MVQMTFCDLSHTFHKQVTNVSKHVFVIVLWGILMSPLEYSVANILSIALQVTHELIVLKTLSMSVRG